MLVPAHHTGDAVDAVDAVLHRGGRADRQLGGVALGRQRRLEGGGGVGFLARLGGHQRVQVGGDPRGGGARGARPGDRGITRASNEGSRIFHNHNLVLSHLSHY